MASVHPLAAPTGSPPRRAFMERSISPTGSNYVVVWEWETKPHRWRPYSPEVTQLLERAHYKKINKIYLKDTDPLLSDFYIDVINFEQVCEPTGDTYPVRREYYAHTSPAAKGAKWEWSSSALTGSTGSNSSNSEWHIYDMEVQTVIEESWATGEQTIDIGQHFPGCPYIINFCNLTQVRRTTGVVRPIRRQPCASYPMVKLTPAEIASMLHRKEERRQEFAAEVERRIKELKNKKHKKAKKAVKHLMNHLLHPSINLKNPVKKGLNPPPSSPVKANHSLGSSQPPESPSKNGFLLPPRRAIGHPSTISEAAFPAVMGRRGGNHMAQQNSQHYKRFHDYASFSSFSDTSSCIVRRPSVDTISTYLSNSYRYGGSSRTASSYYGGSFGGSQDLIDMYGHETDSVFTDEEGANDHISFRAGSSNRICNRYEEPSFPLRKRVLSDPAIHHQQQYHHHYDHHQNEDSNSDLYVNLHENLSLHSRQASQQSFMRSQQSLNSRNSTGIQPQRGDTIYGSNSTLRKNTESPSKSQQNGTLRKRPVPTPRTILNVDKIDRLIRTYSQFVIDPNGPDDYCPVCNVHLDEPAQVDQPNDGDDLNSVVCLTSCQHKVHLACLKRCTPELSSCLKCPTCAAISGLLSGDMPTTGASMTYKVIPKGLPGYEDYHAIQITYNMSSGVQDARHPYPGSPYYAIGFPKSAFLPDTELGRIVLKLLEKAFNQHLTFNLVVQKGSRDAMVQWNPAIGHKTEFGPTSNENDKNAYPDPAFLEDVARQLSRLGITTEKNIEADDEETTSV